MAETRGTILLMVWADIDPEYEAAYHSGTTRSTLHCC